ncbi:MAG: tetratricopeptide repeat protein [Bacteroidales bacterium]
MKSTHLLKACLITLGISILFSSCESLSKMAKNHPSMSKYEVKPNPLETHGDKINISMKGEYKPKFFNKSAVLLIQPSLVYEGGSKELKPVILRGEKVEGEGILISNANGGNFTLTDVVDYTPEMASAQLVLNPIAYTAKAAKGLSITNAKEAAAVPKALPFGEQQLATGTIATGTRFSKTETKTATEKDKYEKETLLSKKSTLYYLVDMSNLNWNLPLNKQQSNKEALLDMENTLGGDMQIKNVTIHSWASPEGEESRNQNLSSDRSKTGEKYFTSVYDKVIKKKAKALKVKPATLKQDLTINNESKGEDWEGFLTALRNSNIPEKNTIINVISSHTDHAAREQEIRNMTVIYKQIEDSILPPLRRSDIIVNFKEAKKTDEQIAELSVVTPDSLLLEELLYAATLNEDKDIKLKIYLSATQIYPEDFRAFLNASALYIAQGNYDEAQKVLDQANGIEPNNAKILNNMGVVSLAKGDFENAKSHFGNAKNSGSTEACSNIGIIFIKEGQYSEAVAAFVGTDCSYNMALAQLMSGQVEDAKNTLNCVKNQTADVSYLNAVCAARQGKTDELYIQLDKAIKIDAKMKAQAKNDAEFLKFKDNAEFVNIVK